MVIDTSSLSFEEEKVFYQGQEVTDRQKIYLIMNAIVSENEAAKKQFCDYLVSFGDECLKKLWPKLVIALNDFECVYRYASINFLTNEELAELTNWVAKNATADEAEKFAVNIPYVNVDYLEKTMLNGSEEIKEVHNNEAKQGLTAEELEKWRDYLKERGNPKDIYKFALQCPEVMNDKMEHELVKFCLLDSDLDSLYRYTRDITPINHEILEMSFLAIYNNMSNHEQYLNIKYIYYFDKDIGFTDNELANRYILESKNHEYMAYQIVDNNNQELLAETFGSYENLYKFSKHCSDFFTEEAFYDEYMTRAWQLLHAESLDERARQKKQK